MRSTTPVIRDTSYIEHKKHTFFFHFVPTEPLTTRVLQVAKQKWQPAKITTIHEQCE